MDKTISAVFETEEYGKFKKLEANRTVSKPRLNAIIESMEKGVMLQPILVNEKFEVIDGQGRLTSFEMLGLPVKYVVQNGLTIDDCRRMNTCNAKWTTDDYVKSFAGAGIEDYQRLLDVKNKTGMGFIEIARYGNAVLKSERASLIDGTLSFSEKSKHDALALHEKAIELHNMLALKGKPNSEFYQAFHIMTTFPQYNHKKMLTKAKRFRNKSVQASKAKEQCQEFSVIWNSKLNTGETPVHFEDYYMNRGSNVRDYSKTKRISDYEDVSIFSELEGPNE